MLAASRYNTQHGGLATPLLATVENKTLREKVKNKKKKISSIINLLKLIYASQELL